jgi:PAS domain S-box-containing protein
LFGYGAWLIQTLNRTSTTVNIPDLVVSNKKSTILVLHVDDDPSLQEITKLMLLEFDSGFEIDNACCVTEALKKIKNRKYDAVVSDYEMPQKNGLQFLKELREQKNDVGFIVFTGRGREDVAIKALNLGADRYLDKNGSPEAVYGELAYAIKNIVEKKKSKQLLSKSEAKYRKLVENSLQGMMVLLPAPLKLVFANEAITKILGYSIQELLSFSHEEIKCLIYYEDRPAYFSRMERRLRGEQAESFYEFRAVRKDGTIVWVEALSNRVEYEGQVALQGIFLNIDDRKKAEERVIRCEARYRDLANSLPEIVFETDTTGKITFFNQRAHEITGFTLEEFKKGVNMLSFVIQKDRERAQENMKKSLVREDLGANEYTLLKKNGATYPALVKTVPIIFENQVAGLRGIALDITEQKKMEQCVVETVKKYRNLVDSLPKEVFDNIQ